MTMTFGSLFSGIEGFGLALERCGFRCDFQAESDAQCRSILQRHFPDSTLYEDVRDVPARPVGLITAGWPCQGNSVAGRRAGMADKRSGLWSEVVRVLAARRPKWFLGENVPGILSVNGGRDWLAVIRDLADLGYGTAYRVLDAQWFGVAQRRRRVFVVGCLGNWRRAAEVLFERESLPWHTPTRREAGARVAACLTRGTDSSGRGGYAGRRREDDVNIVATLNSGVNSGGFRTEPGEHLVPEISPAVTARDCKSTREDIAEPAFVVTHAPFVFTERTREDGANVECSPIANALLNPGSGGRSDERMLCDTIMAVRRLTPTECERLQGFPDGWTAIGHDGNAISDSARYRMLGNSVAVPCIEWIGRRIVTQTAAAPQPKG